MHSLQHFFLTIALNYLLCQLNIFLNFQTEAHETSDGLSHILVYNGTCTKGS